MSTLGRRLETLEERKAFREFLDGRRQYQGRPKEELEFLAVHGYWPETCSSELPPRWEFTVCGIRTIVTTERADG